MSLIKCIFCNEPVGEDCVSDENGAIACMPCASAEFAAQRTERRLERLKALGFTDAADYARKLNSK